MHYLFKSEFMLFWMVHTAKQRKIIAKSVAKFIVQGERTSKYFCFKSLPPQLPAVLGYLFYWGVYCCFQTLRLLLCAAEKYWISIGRDRKTVCSIIGRYRLLRALIKRKCLSLGWSCELIIWDIDKWLYFACHFPCILNASDRADWTCSHKFPLSLKLMDREELNYGRINLDCYFWIVAQLKTAT